jgi:hypothetical protein
MFNSYNFKITSETDSLLWDHLGIRDGIVPVCSDYASIFSGFQTYRAGLSS